ncbi:hypothetical protein CAAN1_10S02674 [[Candida] anglica]|uniref:Uncharacterized protein n=1 Tax=[Candida] anglica TaxID=148631 RepID=A0ABP0EFR3_9ASCO
MQFTKFIVASVATVASVQAANASNSSSSSSGSNGVTYQIGAGAIGAAVAAGVALLY